MAILNRIKDKRNRQTIASIALVLTILGVLISTLLPTKVSITASNSSLSISLGQNIVQADLNTPKDANLVKELDRQGIDSSKVGLLEDYNAEHPYTQIYADTKSDKRFAVVSTLPMVANGQPIVCKWILKSNTYTSGNNGFQASTSGTSVAVTVGSDSLAWNPVVSLNGRKQNSSKAVLLAVDPINENYQQNTLEWDYGICKRHLRLIEGAIYEYYIFSADPNGNIVIKSNSTGNLKPSGYYATDANGDSVQGFSVVGDTKTITAAGFNSAAYPAIVDDSVTVYSTASDVSLLNINSNYATCQAATTASEDPDATSVNIAIRNRYTSPTYRIARGFLYLVPGLLTGDTVTEGALSLYASAVQEINAGHSDLCLYEGTQADPAIADDFNNFGTTLLTAGSYSYEYPMVTNAYTAATLNAAGIALVHAGRAGTVKFCLRTIGDVNASTPTNNNYQTIYSNGQGAGYLPKLVITYTPATPSISNTPSTYDFGYVQASSTYTTGLDYFTVTNDGDITVDITIGGTDMTYTTTTATPLASSAAINVKTGDGTLLYNGCIYVTGRNGKVAKISTSDYSSTVVDVYANQIDSIIQTGGYIWVGDFTGTGVGTLYKLDPDDLSTIDSWEIFSAGGGIYSMCTDDTYIYCGGKSYGITGSYFGKFKISDSSITTSHSNTFVGYVHSICQDGDYLYGQCRDGSIESYMYKILKSDLSVDVSTTITEVCCDDIVQDATYFYLVVEAASGGTLGIKKVAKSDLTVSTCTPVSMDAGDGLALIGDKLVVGNTLAISDIYYLDIIDQTTFASYNHISLTGLSNTDKLINEIIEDDDYVHALRYSSGYYVYLDKFDKYKILDNAWILATSAAADTYALKAGLNGGDYTIEVKKTATYNTLKAGLASDGTQDWGLKFYAPTSFSGHEEHAGTVTLYATAA